MLPHCPKCMTQLLVAVDGTRASTGAAALRCPSCSGFWVPPEVVQVAASVELLGKLRRPSPASARRRQAHWAMPRWARSVAAGARHLPRAVFLGALRTLRRGLVRRRRVVARRLGRATSQPVRGVEPCLAQAPLRSTIARGVGGRFIAGQARLRAVRFTARRGESARDAPATRRSAGLPERASQASGGLGRRRPVAAPVTRRDCLRSRPLSRPDRSRRAAAACRRQCPRKRTDPCCRRGNGLRRRPDRNATE